MINDESKWVWNEKVMACCKILSKNLPKGIEKNLRIIRHGQIFEPKSS
jgi:hypothetical protein